MAIAYRRFAQRAIRFRRNGYLASLLLPQCHLDMGFVFCRCFGLVFLERLFSTKHQQAIRLVHQKIDNTEYSLDLLAKNELNIAEQLQLNRLLEKGNIQTPWVFTHHLWYYLGAVVHRFY
jgi:hypothetical protein